MKKLVTLLLLFETTLFYGQFNFENFDINPGSEHSLTKNYVVFNGELYFSANGNNTGIELWKTNGTPGGTILVKDIRTGTGSSTPKRLTVANNILFFTAQTQDEGRELWKTDGTEMGTVLVKEILPGIGNGLENPQDYPFTVFNNNIVFVAQEPGIGNLFLYESDGTPLGTKKISNKVSPIYQKMVVSDNTLFFKGINKTGPNMGRELWKTNGTEAGTSMVKDIYSGSSSSHPSELTVYNNIVFFVAQTATQGSELWKTNGTNTGTVLVKDIRPGGIGSFNNYGRFKEFNNKLYFTVNDGTHGREIWVTDGSEMGTTLFKDINPGSNSSILETDINQQLFYVFNNKMYFKASSSFDGGNNFNNIEPWVTDGTLSGTQQLADINPLGNSMNDYSTFIDYNGHLFFTTLENGTEGKLWVYDGVNLPTKIQPDNTTFSDVATDIINYPFVFNDALYFQSKYTINANDTGSELWKLTSVPLSIDDFNILDTDITVYPNPTIGTVKVVLRNDKITSIAIYNTLGVQVSNIFVGKSEKHLNLSNLKSGIYILKIHVGKHSINKLVLLK